MADITLRNIKNYLSAQKNMAENKYIGLPMYKKEQIAWRASLCQDCKESGECASGCGCPFSKVIMGQLACEGARWPDMQSPELWEQTKVKKNITISAEDVEGV